MCHCCSIYHQPDSLSLSAYICVTAAVFIISETLFLCQLILGYCCNNYHQSESLSLSAYICATHCCSIISQTLFVNLHLCYWRCKNQSYFLCQSTSVVSLVRVCLSAYICAPAAVSSIFKSNCYVILCFDFVLHFLNSSKHSL